MMSTFRANGITYLYLCLSWAAAASMNAGCAAPLDEESGDASEPTESGSAISSSCGNLGQSPCGYVSSYCNYNLRKVVLNPNALNPHVVCQCSSGDGTSPFAWAGESLGCVNRYCASGSSIIASVKALYAAPGLGTITEQSLGNIPRDPNIIPYSGTDVYVYRATSYTAEINSMTTNMKTLAKAYFRAPNWGSIGPQITDSNRATLSVPLQLLAISNSDMPKSQFSSAALTFGVAATFATGDSYVYALRVNPRSSIFGASACDVSTLTGELQFQIPNGTVIKSLRRKKASGSSSWEYLNKQKTWVKSNCNQNNPIWQCTTSSIKDEL
jgi:hypothetical protein